MNHINSLSSYTSLVSLLIRFGRSEVVDFLLEKTDIKEDRREVREEAQSLADELKKRGPAYIKLGQFFSTQSNLFPKDYIEALKTLQDEVDAAPFSQIEELIKEELDSEAARALLKGMNKEVLASASLGQVYEATLPTGRQVVVKVQRPGAEAQLRKDFHAFDTVAKLLDSLSIGGESLDFGENLSLFKKNLWRELNYEKEAQNLRALRHVVRDLDLIHVPEPVDRYSSERILVMERVTGRKVEHIDEEFRRANDCNELADQLFHAYLKQLLLAGIVHMDPHPGNILVSDSGRLSIIDAGMVSYFSDKMCNELLKMVLAISEGRGEDVARGAIKLGEMMPEFSRVAFSNKIASIVSEHSHLTIGQMQPGKVVLEIGKVASETGLKLPSQFTVIGQTLMKLDSVGKVLHPQFDPRESIRRHSSTLLKEKTTPQMSLHTLYKEFTDMAELASTLPGNVHSVIEKLAHNELQFKIDALDQTRFIYTFEKIANRITAGLVITALILGAALLARVDSSLTIGGYPVIALFMFLGASLLGLKLVWSILIYDGKR